MTFISLMTNIDKTRKREWQLRGADQDVTMRIWGTILFETA